MNYLQKLIELATPSTNLAYVYNIGQGEVDVEKLAANPVAERAILATNQFIDANQLNVIIDGIDHVLINFNGLKFCVLSRETLELMWLSRTCFARLNADVIMQEFIRDFSLFDLASTTCDIKNIRLYVDEDITLKYPEFDIKREAHFQNMATSKWFYMCHEDESTPVFAISPQQYDMMKRASFRVKLDAAKG